MRAKMANKNNNNEAIKNKIELKSSKELNSNNNMSANISVSYNKKTGDLGEGKKIDLDCSSTPLPLLTMSVSSSTEQLVSSSANKIEIKKTKSSIDNNKMSAPIQSVSSATNNNNNNQYKDKTSNDIIMSSSDEQIDKYNAKILKLTDDISKCADEDMVEMMTMTIDGYKNKITNLYSEKQKEEKKKISAETEAKMISDFQETEAFAKLVEEEKKRQDDMVHNFLWKHKLFLRYKDDYYKTKGTPIGDAYAEWAEKVSRKGTGLTKKGGRSGHNKVDERANLALRDERLPIGIVLEGLIVDDVGVKDKSTNSKHIKVRFKRVEGGYEWNNKNYKSLCSAYKDAYKSIKQNGNCGSCWAKLYCLNKDGTPVMKGKAPHYLKHSKWDLLLDDYDEEYFKDKGVIKKEAEVVVATTPDVAEGEKMVFGGVVKVGDSVKFNYDNKKDVEGTVVKITKKTIKVDEKNYSLSKISGDEIVA